MKILFSLLELPKEGNSGDMYSDLAEEFVHNGHEVTIVAPTLVGQNTGLYDERNMRVLRVRTSNSRVVPNLFKKALTWALMPYQFIWAYNRFLKNEYFDVVLMPTPPITFIDFVSHVKKQSDAKFYLILRDIHPQSFYSLGIIRNRIAYEFVFMKAKKAYRLADYIGCMSPGNIEFVKQIVPQIDKNKIVLLPNWMNYNEFDLPNYEIRRKYNLSNKIVALFGGTIGVGQGITNIIKLAEHYNENNNIVFLVVGRGIRKQLLIDLASKNQLKNIVFLDYMPRDEYQSLLATADIGLISLDERYRVPTCPSKVIGYMSKKIPVFAMINEGSDYGEFYIDKSGSGLWSRAIDTNEMISKFDLLIHNKNLRDRMGLNGHKYFHDNFTTEKILEILIEQINS